MVLYILIGAFIILYIADLAVTHKLNKLKQKELDALYKNQSLLIEINSHLIKLRSSELEKLEDDGK